MPPTFRMHIVYRQARAEHAETRATGDTGNIYMITDLGAMDWCRIREEGSSTDHSNMRTSMRYNK